MVERELDMGLVNTRGKKRERERERGWVLIGMGRSSGVREGFCKG